MRKKRKTLEDNDEKKKKKSKPEKKSKSKPKTTDKKFTLYQPVMAEWTSDKYYRGDIYRCHKNGNYDVYFPEDGLIKRGVEPKQLRLPRAPLPNWAKIKRSDFLNMEFEHTDPDYHNTPKVLGKYRVCALGQGKFMNRYLCDRNVKGRKWISGTSAGFHLDVGYVQMKLMKHIFPFPSES